MHSSKESVLYMHIFLYGLGTIFPPYTTIKLKHSLPVDFYEYSNFS